MASRVFILDSTERKKAEEQIKASLEEKEVLLREIHHRVKNNLQIITSLLKLQLEQIKDKGQFHIYNESINRINTMSLIHSMLYKSENLSNIDFRKYIPELCKNLLMLYKADLRGIDMHYKISDIELKIDTAIPCGLIINELISNSLKHAFPGDRKGEISVTLRRLKGNRVKLVISDNGVGMPENIDWRESDSLGLQLVMILAEGQLQGKAVLSGTGNGTEFNFIFER